MGLFDAFGVGGGELSLELQPQAQSGGMVQGTAVFASGRRAQQITSITVRVSCTMFAPGPNGQTQQTQDVAGPVALAGAFASQPGQRYGMPFQLQLPPGLYTSQPNAVSYQVVASADIDGEVDPGARADLYVSGDAMPMQAPMGYGAGMAPMGGPVMTQPQYPNASYGKGMNDSYGKNAGDPYGKSAGDPYGKNVSDPYGKLSGNPYEDGISNASVGKGGGWMSPGQHCSAQWTNGKWYGATVVEENGGMFLVQWDDGSPALWVRADQVKGPPQQVMIGQHCQAQWTNSLYYGATVMQDNGSMVMVQWDDGSAPLWVRYDQILEG